MTNDNNLMLPCPFCGNETARRCFTDAQLGYEDCDDESAIYAIVCNVVAGGCGGSGGFGNTIDEAVAIWNTRTIK